MSLFSSWLLQASSQNMLVFHWNFLDLSTASSVDSACSSVSVFNFHLSTAQVSVKVLLAPLSLTGPRENTSILLSLLLVWTTPLEINRDNRNGRNHSHISPHISHLTREIAAGRGGGHIVGTSRILLLCPVFRFISFPVCCLYFLIPTSVSSQSYPGSQTQIPDLNFYFLAL